MPKRYKPFDVMRNTGARARLHQPAAILYGEIGPPPARYDEDQRVAWLDIIEAAPPGRLEKHHRWWLDLTAVLLTRVRRAEATKGCVKLLGKSLRDAGLTPGEPPTPAAILDSFKPKGQRVN